MAILITTSGKIIKKELSKDDKLSDMQECVGGYIEVDSTVIFNGLKYTVIINEEGIILDLPLNLYALKHWKETIHGNVLLVTEEELD